MLHEEDTSMIIQDANDPHRLYRMDLEYGKVADDWAIHDDIPVNVFAPEKVFRPRLLFFSILLSVFRNSLK